MEKKRARRAMRWAVRVTYPSGEEAWLRHGALVGSGSIVAFAKPAPGGAGGPFLSMGMEDESEVTVERMPRI
jgi:hypothetical protein